MDRTAWCELMLNGVLLNELHNVRPEVNANPLGLGTTSITPRFAFASASHRWRTKDGGWLDGHRNQSALLIVHLHINHAFGVAQATVPSLFDVRYSATFQVCRLAI